jgi:hypothetical protein
VHLAGAGEPGLNHSGAFREAVDSFSNALATGPFHLKITNAPAEPAAGDWRARRRAWTERPEKDTNTFTIDGVMR